MNQVKKEEDKGINGHKSEMHTTQSRSQNPNKELIKLLKKERLNNEILQ